MMQNTMIPTTTQLNLFGEDVTFLRCEECGQWVPYLVSAANLKMVCPACRKKH